MSARVARAVSAAEPARMHHSLASRTMHTMIEERIAGCSTVPLRFNKNEMKLKRCKLHWLSRQMCNERLNGFVNVHLDAVCKNCIKIIKNLIMGRRALSRGNFIIPGTCTSCTPPYWHRTSCTSPYRHHGEEEADQEVP